MKGPVKDASPRWSATLVLLLLMAETNPNPVNADPLYHPTHIEIFTNHQYPINKAKIPEPAIVIDVYDMDAPKRLEAKLSEGLPADPVAAERLVKKRLAILDNEEGLARRFADAYQGLTKAAHYGIDRLPALVFDDGVAVVYGVTDWQKALDKYRQWRRRQP